MSAKPHQPRRPLPGVGYALLMLALLALAFILEGPESTVAAVLAYAVIFAAIGYFASWVRHVRSGGQA
jgi:hypothetical protein